MKQANVCDDIAEVVYDFLPGSGTADWRGHINFGSVAKELGLEKFWIGSSKKPAISHLLQRTLHEEARLFEKLITTIVTKGLRYRKSKSNPVSSSEIRRLNGHLLELGFKFPALLDPEFIDSLDIPAEKRANEQFERFKSAEKLQAAKTSDKAEQLKNLSDQFIELQNEPDRQLAGRELEKLLNELFKLENLHPGEPFRVKGEQIDGSLELDNEIYLIEAKWEKRRLGIKDLYTFRGKISGKSQFTRGIFISMNGITEEAVIAITMGKPPNFFVLDGTHIVSVLYGQVGLPDLLRSKLREMVEKGKVYSPGV